MGFPNKAEFGGVNEIVAATDWLGNRFEINDLVMYCIGAGRGQMMAFGKVQALRFVKLYNEEAWDLSQRKYVKLTDDEKQVEVQVLTERTSGAWDNEKRTRAAWVNPMNITAVKGFEKVLLP